ncbi:MAG: UDP-N-acetylglucosamine 4,6-dehydratase (inverting) [SAR202 cluster bacterium]|nr:UDP-N-acetylglucosamine 4,6-dehydratase (inverting) [SAR202 cluster bacterium]
MDLNDKVVLVTGGTGSFGQRFVETVLKRWEPRKVIVFSRDELKQSEMAREFHGQNIRYFIGDVRDLDRLRRAMRGVEMVVHAAAMKQVPTCEYNPFEAVKTNVLGAANVIEAAIDAGVRKVLAISTDKATNPVNLYGATKLCAEKLFVQGNAYSGEGGTRFSCARYGNVVGSRGSVAPLFLEQRANGPLTVTDERMTRFWITLQQGVDFVLHCLDALRGGEIFVPKLPSMRIMDLVGAVAPGCEVRVTGIRPGEKVHEVLVSEDEAHHTVEQEKLYIIKPVHPWWSKDNWADGRTLPEGFRFSSDTNNRWLSVDELRDLIAEDTAGEYDV